MISYIYFIQAQGNGPIKIGSTKHNPRRRMVKIQTDCPWPVTLLGAIIGTVSQEKQIHAVLDYYRTQGEWFEPHPTVLAAVREAISCGPPAEFERKQRKARNNHPLAVYRAENNVTLRDLSDATGINFSNLSRFESGKAMPNAASMRKIIAATGIPGAVLRPDLAKVFGVIQ